MYKCLTCNKEFKGHTGKNRANKYCSIKCQQDNIYHAYIERWKAGIESGMRGEYQTSRYLRRYMFEKYDYKCASCGWGETNQYSKTIPLELEHIDGNYKNNIEENLTLLCPNCHSLTPTYKGANMGGGRKDRKKYTMPA